MSLNGTWFVSSDTTPCVSLISPDPAATIGDFRHLLASSISTNTCIRQPILPFQGPSMRLIRKAATPSARLIMNRLVLMLGMLATSAHAVDGPIVKIDSGRLEGQVLPGTQPVQAFFGIPFAAPPVGSLRWREPQAVTPWPNTRPAIAFGPRCMQAPLFSDMMFRSKTVSEDCLYLNVWTPAKGGRTSPAKLPVLVYFYGGGFSAGDSSEKRYDGAALAARGIVVVTVNYRLGLFGFLAHPELTAESPHHTSGNYGMLDQVAALMW